MVFDLKLNEIGRAGIYTRLQVLGSRKRESNLCLFHVSNCLEVESGLYLLFEEVPCLSIDDDD